MADVNAAIDYVLQWEDSTLSGVITTADDGKRTRFGIDEHWHPELTNCLYYASMGKVAALQIARGIYELSYCQPLCIAEIGNQEIANKLLSLGVNVGLVPAARMLQDAVTVAGDGRIGPLTLHALDFSEPETVLARLRDEAESYYDALGECPAGVSGVPRGLAAAGESMKNIRVWFAGVGGGGDFCLRFRSERGDRPAPGVYVRSGRVYEHGQGGDDPRHVGGVCVFEK